jgi:hypothetical protein
MYRKGKLIKKARRRDWYAIAFYEGIKPVGGWAAGGSEKLIESAVDRSIRDWFGIVYALNHGHRFV